MTAATAPPDGDYEIGDPAADGRMFRNALGQFGTGVAVVTAEAGGSRVGVTINSFAAVSLDPPLVLWSIREASRRAPAFLHAESFAVNVLSSSQVDVARAFASDEPRGDAFAGFAWSRGHAGAPLLEGALARFECRRHAVHPGGDHHVILALVERCSVQAGEPLIFAQGEFAVRQSFSSDTDDPDDDAGPGSFPHVLTAASHRLSHRFDEHRERLGVSVADGRVLERLSRRPMTVTELGTLTYLGSRAVEDTLAQLTAAGLVASSGPAFELTPEGRSLRQKLAEATREFSRDVLSDLPPDDVRAARRVLRAIASS